MGILTTIINTVLGERDDLSSLPRQGQGQQQGQNGFSSQSQDQMQNPYPENVTTASEKPKTKRYQDLTQAIEARLQIFIRDDLGEHLEIARDDAYFLDRIEVQPQTPEAVTLLQTFFAEFKEQGRINYIKTFIPQQVQRNIILDRFTGLWERPAENLQVENESLDFLSTNSNVNQEKDFLVYLMGEWGVRPTNYSSNANPIGTNNSPNQLTGPILKLQIFDAANPLGKTMEFGTYPIYLGTVAEPAPAGANKINLQGTFVSRSHALLTIKDNQVAIYEQAARNGTWLNQTRLTPPNPENKATDLGALVRKGDWIIFSNADNTADVKDFPRILIKDIASTPLHNAAPATPVVTDFATATPVIMEAAEKQTLALLSIKDANGSHQIDIEHLPFTLGRSQGQNYVIPDANKGVSSQHLRLDEITTQGIKVSHLGHRSNGAVYADAAKSPVPAEFIWEFGQEIILAEKYSKHAPTVSLTLRAIK